MKKQEMLSHYFERIELDDIVHEREHGKKPIMHLRDYPHLNAQLGYVEHDDNWAMSHGDRLIHVNIPDDAIHPLISYLNDLEVVAKDLSDVQSLTQKVISKYEKKNIHHR